MADGIKGLMAPTYHARDRAKARRVAAGMRKLDGVWDPVAQADLVDQLNLFASVHRVQWNPSPQCMA
jgi:hypothetical protein